MREFNLLVKALRKLDEDGEFSIQFYQRPNLRFSLVDGLLKQKVTILHDIDKPVRIMHERYNFLINVIHDRWWGFCYPTHEVHFHKSFEDLCSCPYTCLTEVADIIEKINS